MLVADVGLDARMGGAEALYTYACPPGTRLGQAYSVALGSTSALGFVLRVREVEPEELGFDPAKLKPLGERVEAADLPERIVALVHAVSEQSLCTLPVALTPAVPPGLRDRLVKRWTLCGEPMAGELSPAQRELVAQIRSAGGLDNASLDRGAKSALRALARRGHARVETTLTPPSERARMAGQYRLTPDSDKVERFLTEQAKQRPAQAVLVVKLLGSEAASFSVQELKSLSGVGEAAVRALAQEGLLEEVRKGSTPPKPAHTPNPHQQAAIKRITEAVVAGRHESFLLFGVTGSGKTEVYLRCAAEALRIGKQVLYLVPEIALTAQVVAQLRSRFGGKVSVLHSNMTPQERLGSWLRVRSGESPVVLGPRSALFAPLDNLGLIVVDEEHEGSYKQESAPRYHGRSLALELARLHGAPVVMGSATPSVETLWEADKGQHRLLRLPTRAAGASLPAVELVDLTELYREKRMDLFSPQLHSRMVEALDRGEQVILFLNRRAFSPVLMCRECGFRLMCDHCAVSLAYSKRDLVVRCHHCGSQSKPPDLCPECGGTRLGPFGVGVEKVEQHVKDLFPKARVARVDRDITRRKGALEETLAMFRSGQLDVLVGTQMVAKGLDFPKVTVVGVVAADLSLNIPDFRSGERTFQLLSQVAGRAGRGLWHGHVVVQSLNPEHPALTCAQSHDSESFILQELEHRKQALYPPFVRLVNVLFTGPSRSEVMRISEGAGRMLAGVEAVEVLGPVDCAIERVQDSWRRHILVKLAPETPVRVVADALEGLVTGDVRMVLDVDPTSTL